MTQQVLALGAQPGDGTGTPGRAGGTLINANFSDLYNNAYYFGADTGIVNSCVMASCLPQPAAFTLNAGAIVHFSPAFANNGPATFSFLTSGPRQIVNPAGLALVGGELEPANITTLQYNGTAWQILYINNAALLSQVFSSTLYPQTSAEAALGINPVSTNYPPGYVDRYVNNTGSTVDSSPGFNTAYQVARVTGCVVRFGATEPYYLQTTVNYATVGGPNQNGVVTVYDGAAPADIANFPLIAQINNLPVFDCTGTTSLQFERVAITTGTGFTPSVAFLLARNSTNGGAGLQRFRHCYVIGSFTVACLYNYGAEDDFYYGCYFNNRATTPSTAVMQFTANNVGVMTSPYATIATGSQSTTDHAILACQLYNSAGTTTSYCLYLESAVFLRARDCWMACFGTSSGGQALVGVNQINGPCVNITLDNIMGEQNGVNVSAYGVLFFNIPQQNVSFEITNCLFPNTNLAISCNGTLNSCRISGITEQPLVSHGLTAIGVTNSTIDAEALPLAITTSTNNLISGYSEKWTIANRVNDNWIDTGTANKTWIPVATGLTHMGPLTITNAKMLLFGNQCTVEMTMAAGTSLTPTAGQVITGLPFASVSNSVVDVVDATTPVNLGQGVVSGNTLVMPAFSAGTHSVTVRATFFIA